MAGAVLTRSWGSGWQAASTHSKTQDMQIEMEQTAQSGNRFRLTCLNEVILSLQARE